MTLLHESGVASGLLLGFLFGYVLENAGFGSPCKLTAQFRLSDWSVFKVMFSAIVIAAAGLHITTTLGWVEDGSFYVVPATLGAAAVGGALLGIGFAVGGYCPGTSVVGLLSGRLDALAFLAGLLGGTWMFADVYESIEWLPTWGEIQVDTLPEAFGLPETTILAILAVLALGVFLIGAVFERRLRGPVTASEAVAGASNN
jgi:hypothetical protein